MVGNFKHIHIGELIKQRMSECDISAERAAKFLDVLESEIEKIYLEESIDSLQLLRWSKLLKYDFFRIYSQHLILYSPQITLRKETTSKIDVNQPSLPEFRKNIYTQELILYIIGLVTDEKMSAIEIQSEYNIPVTTVIRWVDKYKNI